jgi:hypothetical protein
MHSLLFRLRYRPVRIGWCIRAQDFDALRRSVLQTYTMCGGAQNPLIAVDDYQAARRLISSTHVDLLLSVTDDPVVLKFISEFEHLGLGLSHQLERDERTGRLKRWRFLNIVSAASSLAADSSITSEHAYTWSDSDPLADVLLMARGRLPQGEELSAFVSEDLRQLFELETSSLEFSQAIPLDVMTGSYLRRLSSYLLEDSHWETVGEQPSGVFVGSATNFWSLVNYWNFRAAGWNLLFYDPAHELRLAATLKEYVAHLQSVYGPTLSKDHVVLIRPLDSVGKSLDLLPSRMSYQVQCYSANHTGLSIMLQYYPEHDVLAHIDSSATPATATMALPPAPLRVAKNERCLLALVVRCTSESGVDDRWAFQGPPVPLLNTYYGYYHRRGRSIRAEPEGVAFIRTSLGRTFTLKAVNVSQAILELLELGGIKAEPSPPGLVTARVISQMGELADCIPLRVRGLRTLIENTRAEKSFTRGHALTTIRELMKDGTPGFDRYEYLGPIKTPRERSPTPEDLFNHMVSLDAFRVGLELECSECSLGFWVSLDNAAAKSRCEYCGKHFDATPQLRDRDWRYRRSGVFGKDDSQQGAIPVALTLLRFLDLSGPGHMLYATSLNLTLKKPRNLKCEIDLIAMLWGESTPGLEVAIGECKTRGEITDEDVDNLITVADVLDSCGLQTFIVFTKLESFSKQECARISKVNAGERQRAILFTEDELERVQVYELARLRTDFHLDEGSLMGLAASTGMLYLGEPVDF